MDKIDMIGPIDLAKIPFACIREGRLEMMYLPGGSDLLNDELHVITAEEHERVRLELDAAEREN